MGCGTSIRDTLESVASIAGNYEVPGSSLVTDRLVSKGAENQLSTPVGEVANIGSGLAGAGVASGVTGIPQSAGGAFEAQALSGVENAVGNAASGIGDSLGLTSSVPNGGTFGAASTSPTNIGSGLNVMSAGASGGVGGAAGSAAPSGIDGFGGDISQQFGPQALNAAQGSSLPTVAQQVVSPTGGIGASTPTEAGSDLGSIANAGQTASSSPSLTSGASSALSPNVGAGNVGTQSIAANAPPVPIPEGGFIGSALNPPTGAGTNLAGGSESSKGFLDNAISSLSKNALPLAISGGGLVMDAIKNQQAIKGENQLKSIAANETNQGNLLQNYLQTGTLPSGLQAGLDQASRAAEASIRSQYAARGMSGSSAEQQDLANLQQTIQAQGANMALNLLQTGINETGMASSLYQAILNETLQKDENLGNAITSFSQAAAGGVPGGGLRLSLSGVQ